MLSSYLYKVLIISWVLLISSSISPSSGTVSFELCFVNQLNLSKVPLLFSPGDAWNYGPSIDILGFIIERVSGKTLDKFLKENIFDIVGMVDTGFTLNNEQLSRLSDLYDYDENSQRYKILQRASDYKEKSFFSGGGGGYSTIEDYSKFCKLLLNNGKWEKEKLVSDKTFNLFFSNQLLNKYIYEII